MTGQHKIKEVEILVKPLDSGMAHFSVQRDGRTVGGHMSGGDPPFVHIDEGVLEEDIRQQVFSAAGEIPEELLVSDNTISDSGHIKLVLYYTNETHAFVQWPIGEDHPDDRVKKVSDLLRENRIGGW